MESLRLAFRDGVVWLVPVMQHSRCASASCASTLRCAHNATQLAPAAVTPAACPQELGVSVQTPQFGLDGFADCPVFDKLWEFCQIR